MCQKNIDKIRLSSYSVHGSLVECQLPISGCVGSSPANALYLNFSSHSVNAPKRLKKIRQNTVCCQIEPKTHYMYSNHGSLVERQIPTSGCACSIPGKFNIFKLGLPPSQDKNAGLYLVPSTKFSGTFRISGAFRKIKPRKI